MKSKAIIQDRDHVRTRFLKAMRHVISLRMQAVQNVSDFADKIGEHQQNISKMENGDRYPTINHLCRLCEVFAISPDWLLLNHGPMSKTGLEPTDLLNERIKNIESEIKELKKLKK